MKTWFKWSFNLLFFGWFGFMWVAAYASYNKELVPYVIGFAAICCLSGAMAFTGLLHNKGFWESNEELSNLIEKHKESIRNYNEARDKLIQKIEEL